MRTNYKARVTLYQTVLSVKSIKFTQPILHDCGIPNDTHTAESFEHSRKSNIQVNHLWWSIQKMSSITIQAKQPLPSATAVTSTIPPINTYHVHTLSQQNFGYNWDFTLPLTRFKIFWNEERTIDPSNNSLRSPMPTVYIDIVVVLLALVTSRAFAICRMSIACAPQTRANVCVCSSFSISIRWHNGNYRFGIERRAGVNDFDGLEARSNGRVSRVAIYCSLPVSILLDRVRAGRFRRFRHRRARA